MAATVGTAVGDHGEGATAQGEDRGDGLGVTGGLDVVDALVGAGGVHLDDLLTRHVSDGVEVVDRAVVEDAASSSGQYPTRFEVWVARTWVWYEWLSP